MTNVIQRSFAGGEIAPSLFARTDQLKYQTGARQVRNFLVRREGGLANRGGTTLVSEIRDSSQPMRELKFVFENGTTANNYVLGFGNGALRFYQNGGRVVTSGVAAWVTATPYTIGDLVTQGGVTYYAITTHISAAGNQPGIGASWQTMWFAQTGTTYEIPHPYAVTDLPAIRYAQSKDVITLTHRSYPTYELKRYGHTRWTLTPVAFGPGIGTPTTPGVSGGVASGIEYFWAVTAIDGITGEEGLPLIAHAGINHKPDATSVVTISWAAVAGAIEYNVYRSIDGITFQYIGTTGGIPTAGSNTGWSTAVNTVTTSTLSAWIASGGQAQITVLSIITDKAVDGKYTIKGTATVNASSLGGTPTTTIGRIRAYYSRDSEPRVDAGTYSQLILSGVGTLGPSAYTIVLTIPDNGYTTLRIDLVPEVLGIGSGVNQFQCTVDESGAPNNSVTWNKGGSSFIDNNMTADAASAPPRQQTGLFNQIDGYPGAVGYANGRLWLANTNTDPERIYGSRPGIFHSFTQSTPTQDDDSVSFRLAGNQMQAIQHVLELTRMLLFTSTTERSVNDEGQAITPTSFVPAFRSGAGSGDLAPIVVINDVLFVQARGAHIRSFRREIQEFESSDLTLFARHLFKKHTIVDWDFALEPDYIVWVVRDDGALLGLTYIPDQEIWGWHRHDTDGFVENVVCIPEGPENAVYLCVRRTINGTTKRFIERMVSRQIDTDTDPRDLFFVDCGLTYDGRNLGSETMTLTGGVNWDEGETLTLTRSVGGFVVGDIGNAVFLFDADKITLLAVLNIEGYTSGNVVTVRPDRLVPVSSRATTTTNWAFAVDQVAGLSHLEGKSVSILADGFVVASPNNTVDFSTPTVVTGGIVTLDSPAAVIHVGLPYISDLETLDIDLPNAQTVKGKARLVTSVVMQVEASRGLWAGPPDGPTSTDPLNNMEQSKLRQASDEYDNPIALLTDTIEITTVSTWDDHGRRFLRQVDPLPVTILSVSPQGYMG